MTWRSSSERRMRIEEEIDKLASKERIAYCIHKWGSLRIDYDSYVDFKPKKRYEAWAWVSATINALRICDLCGSERITNYEFSLTLPAVEGWHWEQSPRTKIFLSGKYEMSPCKHRRDSVMSMRKEYLPYCTTCHNWHLSDDVETCNAPARIERNFLIAERILSNRNPFRNVLDKNRVTYAIWRLYRYCNQTPETIARRLRMNETRVKRLIGSAHAQTDCRR